MKTFAVLALGVAACFTVPTYTPPSPAQQRATYAQSMGYPTRKSAQDLETVIQNQTRDFKAASRTEGRLESPAPYTIQGVRGTCYTVVMRLADGATWGAGAEAGLRFDFQSPSGAGSGGPGVTGPGAVVSVGCAEASGPITVTMAPLVGADPIGSGTFSLELWSHVLTRGEAARLEADKQRQIEEAREFREREAQRKQQREATGCAKCDARYQGCIGAGRSRYTCQDDYRSCAFEEAGPDYLASCPSPR